MDVTVVKALADCLTTAYRDAERVGHSHIGAEAFRNDTVKTSFINFFAALPDEIKAAVKKSHHKRDAGPLTPITLSAELQPSFNKWKENISSFYTQVGYTVEANCSLKSLYSFLTAAENGYASGRARTKLLYVALFLIKERFGRYELQENAIEIFQRAMGDNPPQGMSEKISVWALKGEKYNRLAADLGGHGTLLLLPERDSIWERRLPKTGQKRLKETDLLLARGINEEATRIGAHDVAKSIIDNVVRNISQQLGTLESFNSMPPILPQRATGREIHESLGTNDETRDDLSLHSCISAASSHATPYAGEIISTSSPKNSSDSSRTPQDSSHDTVAQIELGRRANHDLNGQHSCNFTEASNQGIVAPSAPIRTVAIGALLNTNEGVTALSSDTLESTGSSAILTSQYHPSRDHNTNRTAQISPDTAGENQPTEGQSGLGQITIITPRSDLHVEDSNIQNGEHFSQKILYIANNSFCK
ncbi:hypothetical protein McanCB49686_004564 [Microsporum canis]